MSKPLHIEGTAVYTCKTHLHGEGAEEWKVQRPFAVDVSLEDPFAAWITIMRAFKTLEQTIAGCYDVGLERVAAPDADPADKVQAKWSDTSMSYEDRALQRAYDQIANCSKRFGHMCAWDR